MFKAWFRQTVRVERESDAKGVHYGEWGLVTSVNDEAETLVLINGNKCIAVKIKDVVVRTERECLVTPYFNFSRIGQEKLTLMLHQFGFWKTEESYPIEHVTLTKPARLEDEHIRMFSVVLQNSFPKCPFRMFDPQFLRRCVGEFADEDVKHLLFDAMRKAQSEKELLLFPIHCEESKDHVLGHWALLVIEAVDKTEKKMRYYDTMEVKNVICFSKACTIAKELGFEDEPERRNLYRQNADECTEHSWLSSVA